MAHPDDAEFTCAGTLARLKREHGWRVAIATMTSGDCGSVDRPPDEICAIRLEEAKQSVAILEGEYRCAGLKDLFVCYDRDALQRTTHIIREIRPSLVITHSPEDYMVDHEITSTLVRTACFGAPIPNYCPPGDRSRVAGATGCLSTGAGPGKTPVDKQPVAPQEDGLPPIPAVPHLYYADAIEGRDIFGDVIEPTTVIDVSSVTDVKERMLCCHASQREWLRAHHGMDEYVDSMRRWMAMRGQQIGVEHAEAYRQHIGHGYPANDLLAELLCLPG